MKRAAIALLLALCAVTFLVAQRRGGGPPARFSSRGTRGAVAAGSEFATQAGMRMYYRGGNAVDAGVAAMWAAAVTEYSHFGFGGEAPILVRTRDGKVKAIVGVGTMPKLATADFFRKHELQQGEVGQLEENGLRRFVPVYGILPALVPSMVEAGLVALRDFGSTSFAEAIAPAIELADGYPIDEMRSNYISQTRRYLQQWPTSMATFLPGGTAPRTGDVFRQANLAKTLRAMAAAEKQALAAGRSRAEAINAVRDYFYRGDVARRIDAFSKANGGLLRYEDMAAFRLEPEDAVATSYRGHLVYKVGFVTQGPAMIESLNLLEEYNLAQSGFNSEDYIHRVTEALKLAYADRDTYYGDPAVTKMPQELLSKTYAAQRRPLITGKASQTFQPGVLPGYQPKHPSQYESAQVKIDDALMAKDTTCVDAVDKDGVMFSATPSGAWLPSVIAGDTGIPLTQRAQSFLLIEGHPNELAGGKRPRVTLSPTLVTKDGQAFAALSTPGGDNQDQALLQVLLNVIEFGMDAQRAVESPRFQTRHLVASFDNHAMNPGDLLLDDRTQPQVIQGLMNRGHKIETRNRWGSGASPVIIRVTPQGVIEAGADPYGFRWSAAW